MIRGVRARSAMRNGSPKPSAWLGSLVGVGLAVGLLAIAGCGGDSAAPAVAQGGAAPPPGAVPATPPAAAPVAAQAATPAAPPAQPVASPPATPDAPPGTPPASEAQPGSAPAEPPASAAAGVAAAPASSDPAAHPPTAPSSGADAAPAPDAETKPAAPKVASRPEDLTKWKPDDFRAARAEFDPRLVDAIATLGPARAKSEKAAALLVELLRQPAGSPPPAPAPTPAAPPPGAAAVDPNAPKPPIALPPGVDPKMLPEGFDPAMLNVPQVRAAILNKAREQGGEEAVKAAEAMLAAFAAAAAGGTPALSSQTEAVIVPAIIESLGANQTDTARKALKQLLLGQIKTGVPDLTVTGLAARAILQQPASEEHELIIAAALDGSKLRPGGTADPGLQAQLIAALETSASDEVRGKLVDFVLRKNAPEEQRKAMLALLMKPVPGNLGAQAKLLHSGKTDAATRTELERQFAAQSVAAIDRLLGLSGGAVSADSDPAVSGEAASDTTMLRSVIDNIWGKEVIAKLAADAAAAHDIADFAASIPLAVAIPVTGARTMFSDLLREYWEEGPDELKLGTKFGDLAHDPGQLIVAKRVPRKEKPVEKKQQGDNPAPVRQRRGRNADGTSKTEKQDKMRYEWMRACEEFVQSLNARFLAAAQAGAGQRHLVRDDKSARKKPAAATTAAAAPTAASRAGRFPLELLEDSKIIAEYHVCWPDDLSKRLWPSNLSPLAVHYVKLEDNATMTKLNTQYLKQLKGATSRKRSYGRWIDWYGQGVQHGQTRSVDVMLSRAAPASPEEEEESTGRKAAAEEPEPFVTEILVVEIPEFRAAPTAEEEAAAKTR